MTNTPSIDEMLDVAVVGGGASGVYTAWRLATTDPARSPALTRTAAARGDGKLRIALFERSGRVGGRLLSVRPPDIGDVVCELGGMRYMSSHVLVRSLVEKKLGLKTRDLPVDEDANIAYLRGRHLRHAQVRQGAGLPFDLSPAEQGRNPGDLLAYAIEQILPGVTKMQGAALLRRLEAAEFEGQPLYRQGFWNLVARTITSEAYALAKTVIGYDSLGQNWNAVDTIAENFNFTPDVKYSAFVNGYEEVPLTLADLFRRAGGTIALDTGLRAFDTARLTDGTDGVRLRFRTAAGDDRVVTARALVLAMPRRSLELLEQTGPVLDPANADVHALLRSVSPVVLFKLFLCYPFPWWEAAGVTEGRSLTDLPIRQLYYWGKAPAQGPVPGPGVLMVYNDVDSVDFWAGLRAEAAAGRTMTGTGDGRPEWAAFVAPPAMAREAHRQIMEMHGVRYAPEPYAAAFMDWADDPYGGGVHFWNIHEKSWEVIPRVAQPKPPVPVYICGEAYSDNQTWVEGALETAELVLQQHFQLPAPEWVTS